MKILKSWRFRNVENVRNVQNFEFQMYAMGGCRSARRRSCGRRCAGTRHDPPWNNSGPSWRTRQGKFWKNKKKLEKIIFLSQTWILRNFPPCRTPLWNSWNAHSPSWVRTCGRDCKPKRASLMHARVCLTHARTWTWRTGWSGSRRASAASAYCVARNASDLFG